MTTPDPITEQLSAANPVPNVTFLAPTVDDADEFLAVVKGLDLGDEPDTTLRGSLGGGVRPAASDEPYLVMADEFDDLTVDRTVESDKQREDGSKVEAIWEGVERAAPSETRRWPRAVITVAAAILVVVGVVVVADGNGGEVRTDPASVPGVTVPPAVGSRPFFADVDSDTPGCEIPQGWAQVCDAASFGEGVMNAVSAGGPGLVAVGAHLGGYVGATNAVVWTSPDGFTWSRVPDDLAVFGGDGSQQMFDVTAGGPGLVAVGRDGPAVDGEGNAAVWTSPDGFTWSRVPDDEAVFGGPGEQRMVSVTAGGPGLVAVGFNGPVGSADVDGAVWTSPNGFTWTRVPHDEAVFGGDGRQIMLSITVGGPGLVAVGSDGPAVDGEGNAAVWTSSDGLTWSRVPHDEAVFGGPDEQRMASVTAGGPGLVAVGSECDLARYSCSDAAVWTSPDGFTWSRVPHDEAVFARSGASGDLDEEMLSVTAGGPGLVAVGSDSIDDCGSDAAVWTSPDGFTWSRVPDERNCATPRTGYDEMLSVTVGPSGLVAVGRYNEDAAVWNG